METDLAEARNERKGKPLEVVRIGSVSIPIYRQNNIIPQRDAARNIVYGPPDASGKQRALA